jgi:effector-binding domain-containing protein
VGDLPQVFGEAYGAIMQYLEQLGEYPSGEPFAAYYNLDMQDLDLEIGFPVNKVIPGKDAIKPGEIPAGKQVSCIHKGPYSQVVPAYNALMQWINENGYTPTGVAYEFYLNHVPQESELVTKVVLPVK